MAIPKDLKENVFRVLEGHMALGDFEQWLYRSEELLNRMNENVVLEAYAFNYKQPGAKYQFKMDMLKYFDREEFLLWKVKANLSDLIAGKNDRDRILYDLFDLAYDTYPFLKPVGHYTVSFEAYYGAKQETVVIALKRDCEILLSEIERQERAKPGFTLQDFQPPVETARQPPVNTRKWWNL